MTLEPFAGSKTLARPDSSCKTCNEFLDCLKPTSEQSSFPYISNKESYEVGTRISAPPTNAD